MKKYISIIFAWLFTQFVIAQSTYKGYPLIKAGKKAADFSIDNDWTKGMWGISPNIEFDTLNVLCIKSFEAFVFVTDQDTLRLKVKPNETYKFYVQLNDKYAGTVVKAEKLIANDISFDTKKTIKPNEIVYEENKDNEYLNLLRIKYPIDSLVKNAKTDTEKTLAILHWVHKQWKHDGSNEPKQNDAISILEEVKEGKNFRCVEYGIVATACLNAVGLKARVLSLKTQDVATRPYGAGHVLLEVYLTDLKKWAILDGQFDAMPFLNNKPLNAVEFQQAINTDYDNLEIRTASDLTKRSYVSWIYPYLYYFSVPFDNREGLNLTRKKVNDKSELMLVPKGVENPTIFQVKYKINNCIYTNALNEFYAKPNL